jgi:hydroxymethylbilane synthase
VASIIEQTHPHVQVDLLTIKTQGDKILDAPLAKIGGKGLFTKEIEDALLDRRVDLAVHSLKDLPTELPEGLILAAVMKREDPRDVFVSRDGCGLENLPAGARIGTSSLRRRAFLLNRFPHLDIISVRGNLDTRLRKIETENMAGVMLAAAGIIRMGYADRITGFMDVETVIPAIGQGALAIETREKDPTVGDIVATLNDPATLRCVQVERAFLQRMGGGCQVPMAAYCVPHEQGIKVTAAVVHPDGNPIIRDEYVGPEAGESIGIRLADALLGQGAAEILKDVLSGDWQPGPTKDIA